MKTIIAGSRLFDDYELLCATLATPPWHISTVVSGCARGADKLGERWAREHDVPIVRYPAEWKRFGSQAGPLRNVQMAMNASALIAFWDGQSVGTAHMIVTAERYQLRVRVVPFERGNIG